MDDYLSSEKIEKFKIAIHGSMASFIPNSEDWRFSVELMEQYFLAHMIDNDILLSMCGPAVYQQIRVFVYPAKPME